MSGDSHPNRRGPASRLLVGGSENRVARANRDRLLGRGLVRGARSPRATRAEPPESEPLLDLRGSVDRWRRRADQVEPRELELYLVLQRPLDPFVRHELELSRGLESLGHEVVVDRPIRELDLELTIDIEQTDDDCFLRRSRSQARTVALHGTGHANPAARQTVRGGAA